MLITGPYIPHQHYKSAKKQCDGCLTTMKKQPFATAKSTRYIQFATKLFCDAYGPLNIIGYNGELYVLVIVDAGTKTIYAECLKSKKDFARVLISIANKLMRSYHDVEYIRTDGGGAFTGLRIEEDLTQAGISHDFSSPFASQQNGIPERAIQNLSQMAIRFQIQSNLHKSLWPLAFKHSAYILNRIPTDGNFNSISPTQARTGVPPDVAHIRTYGCIAHALITKTQRKGQITNRYESGYYVGHEEGMHGILIYFPHRQRVLHRRHTFTNELIHNPSKNVFDLPKQTWKENTKIIFPGNEQKTPTPRDCIHASIQLDNENPRKTQARPLAYLNDQIHIKHNNKNQTATITHYLPTSNENRQHKWNFTFTDENNKAHAGNVGIQALEQGIKSFATTNEQKFKHKHHVKLYMNPIDPAPTFKHKNNIKHTQADTKEKQKNTTDETHNNETKETTPEHESPLPTHITIDCETPTNKNRRSSRLAAQEKEQESKIKNEQPDPYINSYYAQKAWSEQTNNNINYFGKILSYDDMDCTYMIYFPPQNGLDYSILHASRNRIYRGNNTYISLYNNSKITTKIHKTLEATTIKSIPAAKDSNHILSEIQQMHIQREQKLQQHALKIQTKRLLHLRIKLLQQKRNKGEHTSPKQTNDLFDNTNIIDENTHLREAYKSINLTIKEQKHIKEQSTQDIKAMIESKIHTIFVLTTICKTNTEHNIRDDEPSETSQHSILAHDIMVPTTIAKALKGPHAKEWREAIRKELDSLFRKHQTFTIQPIQHPAKIMKSKLIFKVKANENNTIEKFKVRLTACGYCLVKGVDYDESFAPVAHASAIKVVLERAAALKQHTHKIDITTAYLYAPLNENKPIYMKLPANTDLFGIPVPPGHAALLQGNLYGMPQAGRNWNIHLHKTLTQIQFKRSPIDPCLYTRRENNGSTTNMAVVVDDMLIGTKDIKTVHNIITFLKTKYELTHQAKPDEFVKLKITYHKNYDISISQKGFTIKVLQTYNHQDCNGTKTPAEDRVKLTPTTIIKNGKTTRAKEPIHNEPWLPSYRPAVGQLIYLSYNTRPDITYAVQQVAKHLNSPTKTHWQAVKRIFQYLKHTLHLNLDIRFKGNTSETNLEIHCDASWASTHDRKSITGYIITMNNTPIYWRSKTQSVTAQSTTESEYISTNDATKSGRWIQHIYNTQNIHTTTTITNKRTNNWETNCFVDCNGAIQLSYNPIISPKSRHIEVKYHYIREQLISGNFKLNKIASAENPADILTKALGTTKFTKHCRKIFGHEEPENHQRNQVKSHSCEVGKTTSHKNSKKIENTKDPQTSLK